MPAFAGVTSNARAPRADCLLPDAYVEPSLSRADGSGGGPEGAERLGSGGGCSGDGAAPELGVAGDGDGTEGEIGPACTGGLADGCRIGSGGGCVCGSDRMGWAAKGGGAGRA